MKIYVNEQNEICSLTQKDDLTEIEVVDATFGEQDPTEFKIIIKFYNDYPERKTPRIIDFR